jgi:hypothetical protein
MTPHEAQLEVMKHLSKSIQTWAGEPDEDAGEEFARLIQDSLTLTVTAVNEDGSFTATIKTVELPL